MLRLAALGLGLTQVRSGGQPKPGAASGRQPSIGMTRYSSRRPRWAMNQWPSSPIVMPWRMGMGPAPTKLSQPGCSVSPSTGRPAGLGRSSTHTALPVRAAASST